MSIFDKLKGELVDIIEWLEDDRQTMVYRFARYQNEIKNGAKLVVREGQIATFVNEGQLADVFQPGTYTLETKNLPILATIKGWKYGFNSPFKAECYFVSTRLFTDQKWGTKNPIMLRDAEFGPMRLRAFGTFAMRVMDASVFLRQMVGTTARFTVDDLGSQIRDMLVARFADALGEAKIPALDIASNQDELGKVLVGRVNQDFAAMGLEVTQLVVENVSLPPEVEAAMDKRTSMGVIGNLDAYMKFQTAESIKAAAENPSGMGAMGAGLGAGMTMAQQMANAVQVNSSAGSPPPVPGGQAAQFFIAIDGQQQGPMDIATLKLRVAAGQLNPKTLVWKQGMASWLPADQVDEIKVLLGAVPPPLPPH